MAPASQIHKSITDSSAFYAVVGATDAAVQVLRTALANPDRVQAGLQQVPALAVARALEVAGKAEVGYEHLAERGRVVVEQVRKQYPTNDLIEQGKVGLDRTVAAVTTARKVAGDKAVVVRDTLSRGRHEAPVATVASATKAAVASVTKPVATVRRRATASGASTSTSTGPGTKASSVKGPVKSTARKSPATKPATKSATKSATPTD